MNHRVLRVARRFQKGFALIELLVVIAIIAVLAAMLPPALARRASGPPQLMPLTEAAHECLLARPVVTAGHNLPKTVREN